MLFFSTHLIAELLCFLYINRAFKEKEIIQHKMILKKNFFCNSFSVSDFKTFYQASTICAKHSLVRCRMNYSITVRYFFPS